MSLGRAKVRVEDHPEVVVDITPDVDGYEDLNLQPRPPKNIKVASSKSLVDTGAQMVVMDIKTVYSLGLSRKHIIPVGMMINAANTGGLKLLGGVLVRISGKNKLGIERVTRQLAYIAEEVNRVFLSKKAYEDLGIINESFPTIGAYAMENGNTSISAVKTKKSDEQSTNEIISPKPCEGLDADTCSCPKR